MKQLKYLCLFLLVMTLSACTHNDGDIGNIFGQWKLVAMTTDGVDNPDYKGNVFWSFQNTTIEIKEVNEPGEVYQSFGNFKEMDNTLFLDFADDKYPPRPIVGLPAQSELQIIKLTGGEMILSYGDPATIYTFRKW